MTYLGQIMAIDNAMTATALLRAQQQVYNVCAQGQGIVLVKNATKDELGSKLTETTLALKAFPIRYTPFDREVTAKISWTENVDVICYVPKLQLSNLSLTIKNLKARYSTFRIDNKTYTVRHMEPYSAFANDYLYMVVGGKE